MRGVVVRSGGDVVEVEGGRELCRDLCCGSAVDAVGPAVGDGLRRAVGVGGGCLELDGPVPVAVAVPGCAQSSVLSAGVLTDGIGAPGGGGACTVIVVDVLADLPSGLVAVSVIVCCPAAASRWVICGPWPITVPSSRQTIASFESEPQTGSWTMPV